MVIAAIVKHAVSELVHQLVLGNYTVLESDGRAGRLSAGELKTAVQDYGRTLVELPLEAWNIIEEYREDGAETYALDVPLWTVQEGRSDLTLSITVTESNGSVVIEIDDLHVL